ncbi:MAG: hypothetical protein AAFN70_07435, partial [Planctomycetota bacterium]
RSVLRGSAFNGRLTHFSQHYYETEIVVHVRLPRSAMGKVRQSAVECRPAENRSSVAATGTDIETS